MIGYGTYNQPQGTWSDDSSLAFCLTEVLTQKFVLESMGRNFVKWACEGYCTPYVEVFDIGITTRKAISKLANGESTFSAGCFDEASNGNGSLMRILPLLFYISGKEIDERFFMTRQVSAVTYGHIRSVIACFYYLEFARQILLGKAEDKFKNYKIRQSEVSDYLSKLSINPKEVALFDRLLKGEIYQLPEEKIDSGGYALQTLEASIWCLLTTDNYAEAVLRAVNLGEDTDTTAAVTGGLAGLIYGIGSISPKWLHQLARYDDIENLAERFAGKIRT